MPWDAMLVMVNPLDGGKMEGRSFNGDRGGRRGGVAPSPGEALVFTAFTKRHPRRTYKTYKTLHVHCP